MTTTRYLGAGLALALASLAGAASAQECTTKIGAVFNSPSTR